MNPADQAQQALQLRDIHLPASPEFWPPAPGWWLVAVVAAVFLSWLIIHLYRYWQYKRSQKQIYSLLDDLSRIEADTDSAKFLTSVSTLLRRVALLSFPQSEVAPLAGKQWLLFLDAHGGEGQFVEGVGSVLETGPYARQTTVDHQGLLLLARKWIKQNTVNLGKSRKLQGPGFN